MRKTPFPTLHLTSTTASNLPRSDQDQPQVNTTEQVRAAGGRALVLGGGGSTGNAWLIGVIAGLSGAGLDVTKADLIIGTSAGSTAAAQITGASPAQLLADILSAAPQQRTAPAGSGGGRVPTGPAANHMERTSRIIAAAEDAADMRRRIGAAALDLNPAPDVSGQTRWRYTVASRWGMHLAAQVDELRASGSRVATVFPDSNSEHMFGANAMDLSLRPPAARAGYDQGRDLAEQLTEFWR
ncbi:patatin-like phospholipase family protein [Arthrobacter sp. SPG23]|uniref:patatin-like phospholipase family protein n=1 Tax=Arthrobacter sp. SPG23 TaxID=1610703 RepID=UPI0005B7FC42|nr:patatin-like phospholipase family protein [Arthrobacter sp. SPG23]